MTTTCKKKKKKRKHWPRNTNTNKLNCFSILHLELVHKYYNQLGLNAICLLPIATASMVNFVNLSSAQKTFEESRIFTCYLTDEGDENYISSTTHKRTKQTLIKFTHGMVHSIFNKPEYYTTFSQETKDEHLTRTYWWKKTKKQKKLVPKSYQNVNYALLVVTASM